MIGTRWIAPLVLTLLAAAAPAWALCVCGDRDGCLSAGLCFGDAPGDTCFDDTKTCKITVGSNLDDVCCCACSKPIGPIGCNYGTVRLALSVSFTCGSLTLPEKTDAMTATMLAKLAKADAACRAQQNAKRRADVAVRQIRRFRRALLRAARRGRIERPCAESAAAAIDAFVRDVRQVEQGEAPGSTTTTTLPPLACQATFVASTPSEADVRVRCDGSGGPFQRFQVVLGGGRQLTSFVAPPLFSCAIIDSDAGSADTLSCRGTFDLGDEVVAGIRTGPPPAADMPAQLFVFDAAENRLGPFPTAGP